MWLDKWNWPQDDAAGVRRLLDDLDQQGVSFFHMPQALEESAAPDSFVQRILGQRSLHTQSALIKPRPDEAKTTPLQRRAYPMNAGPAALHLDNPSGAILPPQLVIMICRHAATEGGESLLVDAWGLIERIEKEDPDLYRDTFDVSRTVFISGKPNIAPLCALRRGQLVLFHGASGQGQDSVGDRFCRWIDRAPVIEFRAERGDVFINNNHRLLHGRRGFADTNRELLRFLMWPSVPLAAPARWVERARQASRNEEGARSA